MMFGEIQRLGKRNDLILDMMVILGTCVQYERLATAIEELVRS